MATLGSEQFVRGILERSAVQDRRRRNRHLPGQLRTSLSPLRPPLSLTTF